MSGDNSSIDIGPVEGHLQNYLDELLVPGESPASEPELNEGEALAATEPAPAPAKIVSSQQAVAPRAEVRRYLDTNRPHWAQQQFDAIIICSQGYRFAVPLQELVSVNLLSREEAERFAGSPILSIASGRREGPGYIAHIAKLLLLKDYEETAEQSLSYLLVVKNSDWGLAVDSVSDRVSIDPDAVRWHMDRGNRPWVAGALFDSHYPLLDLRQLLPVLARLQPGSQGGS